jgi:4a-hydroxytetrahydrobiopterin dehydratase
MTKCTFTILTDEEIASAKSELPDWKFLNEEMIAVFKLPDFKSAIDLVNIVAAESERINHHPTWTNSYRRLEFSLTTHDAGNKITNLDIALAGFISREAQKLM